mgnify:CR=1 FL=1
MSGAFLFLVGCVSNSITISKGLHCTGAMWTRKQIVQREGHRCACPYPHKEMAAWEWGVRGGGVEEEFR